MRLGRVGDLIAHAWAQHEPASVLEFGVQLALEAKQDVAFAAPMVRAIAGRVSDQAHAYAAELPRAPARYTAFALVFGRFDFRPIGRSERNSNHLHVR